MLARFLQINEFLYRSIAKERATELDATKISDISGVAGIGRVTGVAGKAGDFPPWSRHRRSDIPRLKSERHSSCTQGKKTRHEGTRAATVAEVA